MKSTQELKTIAVAAFLKLTRMGVEKDEKELDKTDFPSKIEQNQEEKDENYEVEDNSGQPEKTGPDSTND